MVNVENNADLNRDRETNSVLVIRPHHINSLGILLFGCFESPANSRIIIKENARKWAISTKENCLNDPWYIKDVMGETEKNLEEYIRRTTEIGITFFESKYDRLVRMKPSENDSFCRACIFGKHCDQKELSQRIREESRHLQWFIDDVERDSYIINLNSCSIEISKQPVPVGNFDRFDSESVITTTVGTIKEVIRQRYFSSIFTKQ